MSMPKRIEDLEAEVERLKKVNTDLKKKLWHSAYEKAISQGATHDQAKDHAARLEGDTNE